MARKKILVATDLSQKSEAAVYKAIEIAKKYDMWLEVLHVINPPLFEWTWGSEHLDEHKEMEGFRAKKEQELSQKIKEELHRRTDKLNVHIRVGTPADEIVVFAKKISAAIVVLGGSGEYHPLESLVIGTTTKIVIAESNIPVLVIKNSNQKEYQKILVPIDFSENAKKALKYTMELFKDAHFYLLHMIETPSEFRLKYYGMTESDISEVKHSYKLNEEYKMKQFIEEIQQLECCKNSCNITPIMIESSMNAEAILQKANELAVDMISFYSQDINDFTSKLFGSVGNSILEHSNIDVLVYQEA